MWIVGYKPSWLDGVRFIPTRQTGTKYANTTAAVRAACEHTEISETFLYSNDDMFVMERLDEMPVLHRGPLRETESYYAARASGSYLRGMRETRRTTSAAGRTGPWRRTSTSSTPATPSRSPPSARLAISRSGPGW
ncbi:hypothetical protein ACH40F_45080 [Streptomyces sp. NPDC020794]|uniref:hypothetical protein n=1 Tax=unclassified Streptomyces TaxID=2593676 RepID=UPI0036E84A2C